MTNGLTAEAMRTARIAQLNDLARTAMGVASKAVMTPGIAALDPGIRSDIRERVEKFNAFTEDNNPWGERDSGAFDYDGFFRVMWKIDYYDRAMEMRSEDPSDPRQTVRVLTIMLAEEY
jgi:Protein of unknown function (DUF3768)